MVVAVDVEDVTVVTSITVFKNYLTCRSSYAIMYYDRSTTTIVGKERRKRCDKQ